MKKIQYLYVVIIIVLFTSCSTRMIAEKGEDEPYEIELKKTNINAEFEDYRTSEPNRVFETTLPETDFDSFHHSWRDNKNIYVDLLFDDMFLIPFIFNEDGYVTGLDIGVDSHKSYTIGDTTYKRNTDRFTTITKNNEIDGEKVLISQKYLTDFYVSEDRIITCETRKVTSDEYDFFICSYDIEAIDYDILYKGDRIRYYDVDHGNFYYIDESEGQYSYNVIDIHSGKHTLISESANPYNVQYGEWVYFTSLGHDRGLIAASIDGELTLRISDREFYELFVVKDYIYGVTKASYHPDNIGKIVRLDKTTGEEEILVEEATNLLMCNEEFIVYGIATATENEDKGRFTYNYEVFRYLINTGEVELIYETEIDYELISI